MTNAISDITISKKGRPATGATPVMVRLSPSNIDDIDHYRAALRPIPTRPETVRRLVALGLAADPIIRELLAFLEQSGDDADPATQAWVEKLREIVGG